MTLENKVSNLLIEKPSYLKCGPLRISRAIGIEYVTDSQLDAIKVIKKKFKKGRINTIELVNSKPKEPLVNQDFIDQFQLMAEKMGYVKAGESPSSKSKITKTKNAFSIAKRKVTVDPPIIRDQVGMHILTGCNHVPFHNTVLHDGMLRLIKDYKSQIKGFHLMGDFMDLNTLSSHDKGKFTAVPGLTLKQEYAAGNNLLDQFDSALPKGVWKTYLYGNHEDRWNRWMKSQDNAKTPLESPEDALGLVGRNYQVKSNWAQDYFTIGKHLDILHGIYFSVHCAKAHMDKLRGSCAFVHTHRIQQYIEGNMGAFNIGAGADFDSPAFGYATRPMKASWQNGFAIVMVDTDGSYHLTQIICQDGHFYFGGKKY